MRRRMTVMLALPAAVAAAMTMATAPAAAAQHGNEGGEAHGGEHAELGDTSQGQAGEYGIVLDPLNWSGTAGSALLTLAQDGSLTVSIELDGLVPGQPHAQHLHGDSSLSQDFVCPPPEADENGDGFVDVLEGVPFYGDIHVSLTVEGDSSPDSALAVDRMPVADENGQISYQRTFTPQELPEGTAAAIRNLHVVSHGVDINENGEYDFDGNGESELDPELPFEATAPAACGIIEGANIAEVPEGGVDTGTGAATAFSSAAPSAAAWSVAAAGAVLALAVALLGRRGLGVLRDRSREGTR